MRGLPLDPYINDLIVDPDNPSRVYASLNGDGLFRSTDGGRHWTAINAGIPIPSMVPKQRVIVYRCDGVLCISDINGIDPGVYSVDTVSRAAMAPDGGAVAYLTRWAGRWAVRVLDRGSRPKSALSGRGAAPRQLLWSPDSSLLAAVLPSGVEVTNLAGHVSVVRLALYETVVGWSEGGRSLLIWNSWTGRLSLRSVRTSADVPEPGIFQSAPTMASDRLHLAVVSDGLLLVGQVGKPMRRVARVDPQCTAVAWSVDATRLVLQCGQSVQVRASSGALRRWAHLPDTSGWQAEPGNRLLFFHAGGLWEWLPGGRMRPLIANANPA
jgi:hypothetical protein